MGVEIKDWNDLTPKERLLHWADWLEANVSDRIFDMEVWACSKNNTSLEDALLTEKDCGTAACAAGWATIAFRNQPFSIQNLDELVMLQQNGDIVSYFYEDDGKYYPNEAMGISEQHWRFITEPSTYRVPNVESEVQLSSVIERIRYIAKSY